FALTPQQVDHETGNIMELGHSTAVTLATRAANLLAQAEDLVVFSGQNAISTNTLFQSGIVLNRGTPTDTGLLDLSPGSPPLPDAQIIPVKLKDPAVPGVYAENTFAAVAKGYSVLQGNGQYGPYALVLQTTPYADTYAPLPDTLILTADRLKPLMTAGFFGTGTLFSNAPKEPGVTGFTGYTGVLVSLGGNTMDLVVGLDATTAFMQQDIDGAYRFRVLERFALRGYHRHHQAPIRIPIRLGRSTARNGAGSACAANSEEMNAEPKRNTDPERDHCLARRRKK